MTKVLLIESDVKLRLGVKCILAYKGFNVTATPSITHARRLLNSVHFDLIIFDIHNQEENVFYVVRALRARGNYTPVLYLGDRAYKELLMSNSSGLDDFLLKPFRLNDLNSAMRKMQRKMISNQKPLLFGGIRIDEMKRVIWVKEKIISLGKAEMKILTLLARKAGKVVSLDHLYSVYLSEDGNTFNNRIFSYVSSLRRKLEDAGIETMKINFVKNGYRLEVSY